MTEEFLKYKNRVNTGNDEYVLLSEWTSSSTLEFADGKNAEDKLGDINGITSDLSNTSDDIALSAAAGKEITNRMSEMDERIDDIHDICLTGDHTTVDIPQVNDDVISDVDTWSSEKINSHINILEESLLSHGIFAEESEPCLIPVTDGNGSFSLKSITIDDVNKDSFKTYINQLINEAIGGGGQNFYYIRFNGNGATSGSVSSQKIMIGETQKLNTNRFSKNGYIFKGWSLSENGGIAYTDGQEVLNVTLENGKTVDLYAVWELPEGTVVIIDSISLDTGISQVPPPYDENLSNLNGVAPTMTASKTIQYDITNIDTIQFEWNDGTYNPYGLSKAYYTISLTNEVIVIKILYDNNTVVKPPTITSGLEVIDVSSFTGTANINFYVEATSKSAYKNSYTRTILNIKNLSANGGDTTQ